MAHADNNGNGRSGSAPGHQLGSFHGAVAATQALLNVLHKRLDITSAQESAWKAFEAAVLVQANDADAEAAQAAKVTNAVDALDLQATLLKQQADDAAAVTQAFSALYGMLTTAQRAVVDDAFKHGLAL